MRSFPPAGTRLPPPKKKKNASSRAVTRCAPDPGWEVFGVSRGYAGLIDGIFEALTARSVRGIIQQGGTMLGSARSAEFQPEDRCLTAVRQLHQREIDGLVVIGGNGSQARALALAELAFTVVGGASTIDNDLPASDITVGADTGPTSRWRRSTGCLPPGSAQCGKPRRRAVRRACLSAWHTAA